MCLYNHPFSVLWTSAIQFSCPSPNLQFSTCLNMVASPIAAGSFSFPHCTAEIQRPDLPPNCFSWRHWLSWSRERPTTLPIPQLPAWATLGFPSSNRSNFLPWLSLWSGQSFTPAELQHHRQLAPWPAVSIQWLSFSLPWHFIGLKLSANWLRQHQAW